MPIKTFGSGAKSQGQSGGRKQGLFLFWPNAGGEIIILSILT